MARGDVLQSGWRQRRSGVDHERGDGRRGHAARTHAATCRSRSVQASPCPSPPTARFIQAIQLGSAATTKKIVFCLSPCATRGCGVGLVRPVSRRSNFCSQFAVLFFRPTVLGMYQLRRRRMRWYRRKVDTAAVCSFGRSFLKAVDQVRRLQECKCHLIGCHGRLLGSRFACLSIAPS